MTECERCEIEHDLTFRLTNVRVSTGAISSIHSAMVVCAQCKTEMEDSENYSW